MLSNHWVSKWLVHPFYFLFNSNKITLILLLLLSRQHQLRVHLQAIGFPIYNDVLYGGTVKSNEKMLSKALQAMSTTKQNDISFQSKNETLTEEIIQEAKDFCLCCKGNSGIQKSFNSHQLLMEGHAIDLHALSYRIKFAPKRKQSKQSRESENVKDPLAVLDLSVNPPSWAKDIDLSGLKWLDN
jgi:hypothetical protein